MKQAKRHTARSTVRCGSRQRRARLPIGKDGSRHDDQTIPRRFCSRGALTEAFTAGVTQAAGACAVYRLTKTSLTSPEALRRLTAALGAAQGAAALAGLKDKHARTIQHVTVRLPPEAESRQADGSAAGPGWEAVRMGWCDRPIDAGAIAGNHFRIVVRGLTGARCAAMNAAAGAAAAGAGRLRLVNYFGDQRFGSARHHKGFVAPHLIRGEFEAALRLAIATVARQDNRARRRSSAPAAAGWGRWEELARTLRQVSGPAGDRDAGGDGQGFPGGLRGAAVHVSANVRLRISVAPVERDGGS